MGEGSKKGIFFNTQYSSIPFFHYSKGDFIVPFLEKGAYYDKVF
jgi:hypothetical protein